MDYKELKKYMDNFFKSHGTDKGYLILEKNKCLYAAYKLGLLEEKKEDVINKLIINERKFFNTLRYLCKVLANNNIGYVLIKTKYRLPYIDNNIDILLKNKKDWILLERILFRDSFSRQKVSKWKYWHPFNEDYKAMWTSGFENYVAIHLHYNVAWRGIIYLDKEAIFKHKSKTRLFGFDFFVPSASDDFLIHSAHTFFENFNIKFLDYLTFNFYKDNIDFNYCFKEAKKYGWEDVISIIYKRLKSINSNNCFPVCFSVLDLSRIRFKKTLFDCLNLKIKMLFRDIIMYPVDLFAYSIYHKFFIKNR